MTKLIYVILSFLKYILILWVPVLLIEETFLLNYINVEGTFICSLLMSALSLVVYIKTYKKVKKEKINCYEYNIINTILLVITNLLLGYLFMYLIYLNIFHQCMGTGWDCFLFGLEYLIIGVLYAVLSITTLVVWLMVKLIINIRKKNKLKKGVFIV